MKTLGRVAISVLVLVVTVPVVLIVGVGIWLHFAWAPPDIHKQIKSAGFQQRHTTAVTDTDQDAVTFFRTAPHGTRLADAVRDQCNATSNSFGAKPTTECSREVIVYMAFDGDLPTVQHTWSKALAGTGWVDLDPGRVPGYQQFGSDHRSARITWHTRPEASAPIGDFQKGIPDADSDRRVTLEQKPVDVADVYQDAYAQNRYLAEISIHMSYFPGPPLPSPTPTRSWNGCFGGHGNCPGG